MSLVTVTILIYLPVCVLNRGAQDLQVLHLQPLRLSLQTLQTHVNKVKKTSFVLKKL